jgi:hypothetical protein
MILNILHASESFPMCIHRPGSGFENHPAISVRIVITVGIIVVSEETVRL